VSQLAQVLMDQGRHLSRTLVFKFHPECLMGVSLKPNQSSTERHPKQVKHWTARYAYRRHALCFEEGTAMWKHITYCATVLACCHTQ